MYYHKSTSDIFGKCSKLVLYIESQALPIPVPQLLGVMIFLGEPPVGSDPWERVYLLQLVCEKSVTYQYAERPAAGDCEEVGTVYVPKGIFDREPRPEYCYLAIDFPR